MTTLSHSESRRLYSWWWDSHVPKNSKWIQDNLTDMDAKVKAMIKLIEEDADSFARRAEMYYKKRPELMKLVEEFYRAYRALAERYDHMTGELRHTQRTIAAAFPNQLPFVLDEDSLARSSASDTESHMPDISQFLLALLGPENNGLQAESIDLSSENENLKAMVFTETQRAVKAESELQELNKTLADMQAEKDGIFLQYQICLDKLSNMEADLNRAENDSISLNEQKLRSESEVQTIKKALADVEVEKEAALADLEILVSHAESNLEGLTTKVVKLETESRYLTDEISVLLSEKEEKISYLEGKLSKVEEKAEIFKQKAENAENEVNRLRRSLAVLAVEKECTDLQYKNCLKRISALESELSRSREDVKQLNIELQSEAMKCKDSEVKCIQLEISKQSLHKEADDLAKKFALRDDEHSRNHEELKKLEASLKDEGLRYTQIEAKLQTLQIIHSQAQKDHKALVMKLESGVQMLKEMEICKRRLEDEVQQVKNENLNFQEEKELSVTSIKNMQNEISYLKMMKARLEEEVIQQTGQTSSLEQEISSLVKEISGLNQRYQSLIEKLDSLGLNPDTIQPYIKNLQDEKSNLLEKLEHMEEVSKKNNVLESSISELQDQLEASQYVARETEETSQLVLGEKSALFAEKAALLTQLHTVTENLQKALRNNAILENSLSDAKIELAGLREKSKGFEEICHLLKNEKSDLLTQRDNLVIQLENVERRTEYTEHKFAGLEERYINLEKMNKFLNSEIQDLTMSLSLEKQERTNAVHHHETLLVSAEQHIHLLQEENRWTAREYEDELDKAGRVQIELFILQKFIQDMDAKNRTLLIESRKYVEASKLAEKLISELERENLEQEVEAELFIDEIEKLRLGIYRIFKVLESDYGHSFQEKVSNEQNFVHHIIRIINEMKLSIINYKDEKQSLQVENSVLSTLLGQMASEGMQTKSKNELLEDRLSITTEKLMNTRNDKDSLLEINTLLKSQLDNVSSKHRDVENAYMDLLENHFQLLDENRCLCLERSELDAENCLLEGENDGLLLETLAFTTCTTVLESFANEKALESSTIYEALHDLIETKDELEMDMNILKGKLESNQEHNTVLENSVQQLETEVLGVKDALRQREDELVEADWNFRTEEEMNIELSNDLVALKAKYLELSRERETIGHQLLEISEDKGIQFKEIEGLREVNTNLVSELSKLREECEEHKNREKNLSAEFELWEAEAAAFYFDIQVSSIQGVFYESKVHELSEVCGNLEDQTVSRSREIQEMKGKLSSMESEIEELKSELSAYAPVIASLRDDVTSLEYNSLLHTKLTLSPDNLATKSSRTLRVASMEDKQTVQTGIQDLKKLQCRIKAVEKTMAEEIKKQESMKKEGKIKDLKPRNSSLVHSKIKENKDLEINVVKSPDAKRESLAFRKGSSMKDILLDQISESPTHRLLRRRAISAVDRVDDKVLELWQIAEDNGLQHRPATFKKIPPFVASLNRRIEHPSTVIDVEKEVNVDQEANNNKTLERLASDARKLTNLQLAVENLNKKLDFANKKHKKAKDVDLDTVKEQLQEVQETVYQLMELNGRLMGNFEGSPFHEKRSASVIKRNRVSEQSRKVSEKIGRLLVEVQKIEYILLKLEEEKKSKGKGRFIKNRTTIVLRDFIYNGRKNSGKKKKKKSHLCGCFRSSNSPGKNQI